MHSVNCYYLRILSEGVLYDAMAPYILHQYHLADLDASFGFVGLVGFVRHLDKFRKCTGFVCAVSVAFTGFLFAIYKEDGQHQKEEALAQTNETEEEGRKLAGSDAIVQVDAKCAEQKERYEFMAGTAQRGQHQALVAQTPLLPEAAANGPLLLLPQKVVGRARCN